MGKSKEQAKKLSYAYTLRDMSSFTVAAWDQHRNTLLHLCCLYTVRDSCGREFSHMLAADTK